jgi:hypothetical protein
MIYPAIIWSCVAICSFSPPAFPQGAAYSPGGLASTYCELTAPAYHDGNLGVVGHNILTSGPNPRLAEFRGDGTERWDGKTWRGVGPGLISPATALAVDRFGNLYAAGYFPTGEWDGHYHVLRWDGASWQAIADAPEGITALACDASGNLYIGTSQNSRWPVSLYKWDDNTMSNVPGAPMAPMHNLKYEGVRGHISQLDVIDSMLCVQGEFSIANGKKNLEYAIHHLGAPDTARISAKLAAMRRAASKTHKPSATIYLKGSGCTMGAGRVIRSEKMEIANQTAVVLDSAVLYTTDSSGFMYDKTEAKWGHVSQHPVITSSAAGFRFSFPLGKLLPGQKLPFWISKSLRAPVAVAEPDAWIYKDTLKPLFSNVAYSPDLGYDSTVFRIFFAEYDSFTIIRGGVFYGTMETEVSGLPGAAFEVRYAKKNKYDRHPGENTGQQHWLACIKKRGSRVAASLHFSRLPFATSSAAPATSQSSTTAPRCRTCRWFPV